MKVLVTGAAGFIGQHVTKALIQGGCDVIALDILAQESIPCQWITRANITNPINPVEGLDAVIHLAALSHPRQCDENPSKAFDVNVNGTHQVLKMALESG